MFSSGKSPEIHKKERLYFSVPEQVDLGDLILVNNVPMLLNEEQMEFVKEEFKRNNSEFRINLQKKEKFKDINYGYALHIIDETGRERYLYSYRGLKHGKGLGEGGYGYVKLAQDIDTGEWFVVKITNLEKISIISAKKATEEIQEAEAQMLKTIGLTGEIRNFKKTKEGKEVHKKILLQHYVGGVRLDKLLKLNLSAEQRIKLCANLLDAYNTQIKGKKVLHRDIKPENIIINPETLTAKFIDFGLSTKGDEKKEELIIGTEGFLPPEINLKYNESVTYNEKTEIYSLGKVFSIVLGLESDPDPTSIFFTTKGKIENNNKYIKNDILRNKLFQLVLNMTNSNSKYRSTFSQADKELNTIQREFFSEEENKKVYFLDYELYADSSESRKKQVIDEIKGITDSVQLVIKNELNELQFNEIQRNFKTHNLFVKNTVLIKNELEEITEISTEKVTAPKLSVPEERKPSTPHKKSPAIITESTLNAYKKASFGKNNLEAARNLLNDYTKGDHFLSGIVRLLHGHANRHYTKEIAQIVRDIDNKKITNVDDLLKEITSRITIENEQGSLARRLKYIEEQFSTSKSSNNTKEFKSQMNANKIPVNEKEENIFAVYKVLQSPLMENTDETVPLIIEDMKKIIEKINPNNTESIAQAIVEIKGKIQKNSEISINQNVVDVLNAFAKSSNVTFNSIRSSLSDNAEMDEIMNPARNVNKLG